MTESIRVLYVDDDAHPREIRASHLAAHNGIEVLTDGSVREGIETLSETHIDCILSDVDMARQSGIEFLETVRADRPMFPFVLFSSHTSRKAVLEGLDAGATDYVFKQSCVDGYDILVNRIELIVDRYRLRKRFIDETPSKSLSSGVSMDFDLMPEK